MLQGSFGVTEVIFIGESRDEVAKGDRDVVHVRVAVPHDRDRDALRCITIEGLLTCLDQANLLLLIENQLRWKNNRD